MNFRYILQRWGGWIFISVLLICVIFTGYKYSKKSSEIKIATAGSGGYYYKFGSILKKHLEKHTDYIVVLQETKGSQDNRSRLLAGKSDIAILQPAAVSMQNLQAVAPLWDDFLQVIVRKNANIKSLKDLEGRNVSLGENGSGTRLITMKLLEYCSIRPEHFGNNSAPLSSLLKDSSMIAGFESSSLINPTIAAILKTGDFELLPVDSAQGFSFHHPYISGTVPIPKGVYPTINKPIPEIPVETLSSTAILAARKNINHEIINDILHVIYTIELSSESPVLVDRSRTQNSRSWAMLPVHQAAKGFFNPYEGAERLSVLIDTISNRARIIISILFTSLILIFIFYISSKYQSFKDKRQFAEESRKLEIFISKMAEIEWRMQEAKDMRLLKQYLDEVMEIRKQILDVASGSRVQNSILYLAVMQESIFLIHEIEWKLSAGSTLSSKKSVH